MSVNDFHSRWSNAERELGYNAAPDEFVRPAVPLPAGLDDESRSLLQAWGLPREAGPMLGFEDTARMPHVYEVFSPGTWKQPDIGGLEEYRMLGSDGAGNPICVHERSGEVWLLDHEDHFRTRQFMNSSIAQLAECLLAYIAERDGQKFAAAVSRIDDRAGKEGTFWRYEVPTGSRAATNPPIQRTKSAAIVSFVRRLLGRGSGR